MSNCNDQEKHADLVETSTSTSNSETGQIRATGTSPQDGMHNFKTMHWWHVSFLMIAEVISLGVLALPSATSKIGFVPGVLLIALFGALATYAGHTIGRFKLAYPQVHNMSDVGEIVAGKFGRHFLGYASVIFLIFVASAHVLSFEIMMNVVTGHAACTMGWGALSAGLSFICCLCRRLEGVSWISVTALISIISAVFLSLIALGIAHPHGSDSAVAFTERIPFTVAFIAVMDIVMAFSGSVAFFGFISEMRNPAHFTRALYTLNGLATTLYITVAVGIYAFAGSDVGSPALSSAGHTVRIVAYCIASPTIVVSGVVNGHVASTVIFRALKPKLSQDRTWQAWWWWVGLVGLIWTLAFVLAETIPVFDNLIALLSALLGTWFTYGISGFLWLFMNKGRWTASKTMKALAAVNMFLVVLAAALCVTGTYASIKALVNAHGHGVWTCKDNSS